MSRFLVSENIRRFKSLLAEPLDPDRRRTIEALLEEEQAKLSAAELEERHADEGEAP